MEIKIHSQCGETEERMQGIDRVGRLWRGPEPPATGMASKLAVAAITGYQRYISPHKGFRCAHRMLHGGESCSQFIKRHVERKGLLNALKEAPERFRACGTAYRILRAESDEDIPWYRQSMLGKVKIDERKNRECWGDVGNCLGDLAISGCCEGACNLVALPCLLIG
jgi:putative component of membrane protein insertase Oxa1/YidC/SpoIIIJ protein YidD